MLRTTRTQTGKRDGAPAEQKRLQQMRSKHAQHMEVVRREQKRAKLKAFIRSIIENDETELGSGGQPACLLVARSPDSPVAKALADVVRQKRLGRPVRVIFAGLAALEAPRGEAAMFADAVRLARNPRLLDVHEQLVLGPRSSWIGDSMRRDPTKSDAYEWFAGDCRTTASWASCSFERLWQIAEPVCIERLSRSYAAAPPEDCHIGATSEEPQGPQACSTPTTPR